MALALRLTDFGLAAVSAFLLVLCFPTFDLEGLAWIGLVPLLLALEGKGPKAAFLLSHIAGIIFFTGIFFWIWAIRAFNLLDYTLLGILYLPSYVSLWGLGLNSIRRRTGLPPALVAPPLWVTLEYVRSHAGFLSLPWMLLGHSQYLNPSLIQITSLTGVYGLSFLIVLTNVAVSQCILYLRTYLSYGSASPPTHRFPVASIATTVCLLFGGYSYGTWILNAQGHGETFTLSLVQANIPQAVKWDKAYRNEILDRYAILTRDVVPAAPDLIVWPETAVPGDVQHDAEVARQLGQIARDAQSYLLTGSAEYAKFTDRRLRGKAYNSMYLLSPDGKIQGQYRKIALVPFGEYVPLKDFVKWPEAIAAARSDIVPGEQHKIFSVRGVPIGAIICWEAIFPDLFRQFVKRGARLMINATNEGRFYYAAASYQLLAISTFRAAENRVALARATNTGISAFIDPYGRITSRLRSPDNKEVFINGTLSGAVFLSNSGTFYTRYGDIFTWLLTATWGLLVFYKVALRARNI